jgi:hypothetical protein
VAKAAGIVGLYMAPPGNAIVLAMNASKHVSPIVHRPFMHLRWGARYAFALGHPLNLSSRITVAGHRDLVKREEFVVFPSHGLSVSVVRILGRGAVLSRKVSQNIDTGQATSDAFQRPAK